MWTLQELSTRMAVLEQRMNTFESIFKQYAEERKEQHDRMETKLDWVKSRMLYWMGAMAVVVAVISVAVQAAFHYLK